MKLCYTRSRKRKIPAKCQIESECTTRATPGETILYPDCRLRYWGFQKTHAAKISSSAHPITFTSAFLGVTDKRPKTEIKDCPKMSRHVPVLHNNSVEYNTDSYGIHIHTDGPLFSHKIVDRPNAQMFPIVVNSSSSSFKAQPIITLDNSLDISTPVN